MYQIPSDRKQKDGGRLIGFTLLSILGFSLLTVSVKLYFVWQENIALRQENNYMKSSVTYQTIVALNQTMAKLLANNTSLNSKCESLIEENTRLSDQLRLVRLHYVKMNGRATTKYLTVSSIAFTTVSEEARGSRYSVLVYDGHYEIELPNHREYAVLLECPNYPGGVSLGSWHLDSDQEKLTLDWEER